MAQNICYLVFSLYLCTKNKKQMEENNNFEHIIDGLDEYSNFNEYAKITEELNNKIVDELLKTTGVPKEYSNGFEYPCPNKPSWWNDASSRRYIERMEEIANSLSEESKKLSLKMADPLLINKNLCYAMKKFGSIRKFKKAAKKQHPIFGWTVYNPMQYIPMFKVLSKAKNDKERRDVKCGIKKLFKFNFFDETEFATVKDKDLIRDFADNMRMLWNYNSIDFETNGLRVPPMNMAINY